VAEDDAALADEAEFEDLASEIAVTVLEFVEPCLRGEHRSQW
jgi:hypothetical protein